MKQLDNKYSNQLSKLSNLSKYKAYKRTDKGYKDDKPYIMHYGYYTETGWKIRLFADAIVLAGSDASSSFALLLNNTTEINDRLFADHLVSCKALLRVIYDACIKAKMYFLVDDKKKFLNLFLSGDTDKIKKSFKLNGSQLSDRNIIKELNRDYPNLEDHYNYCCSFIHISYILNNSTYSVNNEGQLEKHTSSIVNEESIDSLVAYYDEACSLLIDLVERIYKEIPEAYSEDSGLAIDTIYLARATNYILPDRN